MVTKRFWIYVGLTVAIVSFVLTVILIGWQYRRVRNFVKRTTRLGTIEKSGDKNLRWGATAIWYDGQSRSGSVRSSISGSIRSKSTDTKSTAVSSVGTSQSRASWVKAETKTRQDLLQEKNEAINRVSEFDVKLQRNREVILDIETQYQIIVDDLAKLKASNKEKYTGNEYGPKAVANMKKQVDLISRKQDLTAKLASANEFDQDIRLKIKADNLLIDELKIHELDLSKIESSRKKPIETAILSEDDLRIKKSTGIINEYETKRTNYIKIISENEQEIINLNIKIKMSSNENTDFDVKKAEVTKHKLLRESKDAERQLTLYENMIKLEESVISKIYERYNILKLNVKITDLNMELLDHESTYKKLDVIPKVKGESMKDKKARKLEISVKRNLLGETINETNKKIQDLEKEKSISEYILKINKPR